MVVGETRHAARGGLVSIDTNDIEYEHRLMRDHRPTGFGDDVGIRDAGFRAGLSRGKDDVVRVLLHGVVHRRRIIGSSADIVDA